ncbi:MAG TPA: hypothetical protein VM240_13795 [Verrucomicrobiae bacterium]|nr:hypothetical protein [Verrucomicrobiae bacterium]
MPLTGGTVGRPRRKREELEVLAANFVNSRLQKKMELPMPAAAGPRVPRAVLFAGVALFTIGALAWLSWPETEVVEPSRDAAASAQDTQLLAQRLEAQRERQRKELESGRVYLDKIASADSALLADMTARAQALESRAAPTTAKADAGGPTPRLEAAIATPAPAPAAARPLAPASQEAPALQPVEMATAPAASCNIHVSELSSSGKLTYADVARMKGARTDASGHVFTPPVAANGRTVVFEVLPSGCVRIARTR